ncbi:SpoIIE family protein phosphatase [uncultured Dysosmobacter sp.]|uniref:SpoIIE family protein phosphatase n=1 Tax=uncultured Dysosmobacter sp. TaxID=2591384 RepID=UPI002609983C|nr:SpoIIE family protein phosphatase [uncultured Dysosmobacter sp.]
MEHGQITWKRSAWWMAAGIRFFLAAALTASRTAGGYVPFALGFVAAAGPGAEGAAALAGLGLGALLFLDFAEALPAAAVGVLLLTASTAFRGSPALARPKVLACTAVGLFLAVDIIYVVESLAPLERLTPCLAAAGLTGAAAWFFQPLLRPEEDGPLPADSLLFLAAALLLALADLELLGLSLGRMLLCVLLAYTAYERGAVTGAAAGLGIGLTADLCAGTGGGIFTAGLGLAGLLAGSQAGRRRSRAAGAFLLASLAALLPAREPLAQPLLLESAAGMAVFLLLPGRLFGGKRIKKQEPLPESAVSAQLKARLNRAARALRDLYDSMGRTPSTDENPAIIFDRAAERVCRGCALCGLCWQREYTGTFNAFNDATPYLLERGRALPKDFPAYFTDRCVHLPDLLTAVNGELSAYLLRRQYRRQLEETRRSARGQYAQLSELLTATAAGLGEAAATAGEADFACQVGAALRPREGETVCGDTVMSFQTETGRWCLLLADGMGSGEPARRESALTCRLLRQFLEAGIEPEAALKTLNAAMALRGAETGSFTTVDLCVLDPATGETVFYKYGAAPSYLKKGGAVRRITGGSLPVGLRGAPASPDVTKVELAPGGFVVMISDGVADPGRDEWLQDLLAGWEGEDPQALAGLLLAESVRRERLQDDCGIQVLYRPAEGIKKV